jgi:3-methylfumaryl-CoA hydratase
MPVDINTLREWIGKTESRTDQVSPFPIEALSATLDRLDPPVQAGDPLPPLWHWLYFLPLHRHSELGSDGHAKRGGFLPPVALPRRMWAGSRLVFRHPLRVGENISRTSRIADVNHKEGRSGSLLFVALRHEISNASGVGIIEEQDLVFCEHPKPGETTTSSKPVPTAFDWDREIVANEVLLFRYSALTFNGHRIHYDRRYSREVEGYPGLAVHGPLLATLLLDLLRRNAPNSSVREFAFRAVRPLFDTAPFSIRGHLEPDGRIAQLWAQDANGSLAVEATAVLNL